MIYQNKTDNRQTISFLNQQGHEPSRQGAGTSKQLGRIMSKDKVKKFDFLKEYSHFPKIRDVVLEGMITDELYHILKDISERLSQIPRDHERRMSKEFIKARNDEKLKPDSVVQKGAIRRDLRGVRAAREDVVNDGACLDDGNPYSKLMRTLESERYEDCSGASESRESALDAPSDSVCSAKLAKKEKKSQSGLTANGSPSSPNFGFKNPRITLNEIINDPELNQKGEDLDKVAKTEVGNRRPVNNENRQNMPNSQINDVLGETQFILSDLHPKFIDKNFPIELSQFNNSGLLMQHLSTNLKLNPTRIHASEFKRTKRVTRMLADLQHTSTPKIHVFDGISPADVQIFTKKLTNAYKSALKSKMVNPVFTSFKKASKLQNQVFGVSAGDSSGIQTPKDLQESIQLQERLFDELFGYEGNILFLSILSAMAVEPSLITRLLEIDLVNSFGVYCVWLNIEGFWKKVVIDDRFPMKDKLDGGFDEVSGAVSGARGEPNLPASMTNGEIDEFRFSALSGVSRAIWPLLIEKAYAKCYLGYSRVPREPSLAFYLRDLTGAPVLSIPLKFRTKTAPAYEQNFESGTTTQYTLGDLFREEEQLQIEESQLSDAEEVWEILIDGIHNGYFMTASLAIDPLNISTESHENQNSPKNRHKTKLLAFPILNCADLSHQTYTSVSVGTGATSNNSDPEKSLSSRYIQIHQPFNLTLFPEPPTLLYSKFEAFGLRTNPETDQEQGLVWVNFVDFLSKFQELGVTMLKPWYVYGGIDINYNVKSTSSFEDQVDPKDPSTVTDFLKMHPDLSQRDFFESYRSVVKLRIWEEGEYTISFNKAHKDKFRDIDESCRELELGYMSAMTIARLEDSQIIFIDSKFDKYRNTVIHRDLEPGEYIVLLDIRYTLEAQLKLNPLFGSKWKSASLSCYGPFSCSLMELEQDLAGVENLETIYAYFEHQIWKDFVNNPPEDMSDYVNKTVFDGTKDVIMVNGQTSTLSCRSLSVNHVIIEVLGLDKVRKSQNSRSLSGGQNRVSGLVFGEEVLECRGFEVVAPGGRIQRGEGTFRMVVSSEECEVLVMRFGEAREREFRSRMINGEVVRGEVKNLNLPENSSIYQKIYNLMLDKTDTVTERNPKKRQRAYNEKMKLTNFGLGKNSIRPLVKEDLSNVTMRQSPEARNKSLLKFLQNGDFYVMSKFKRRGALQELDFSNRAADPWGGLAPIEEHNAARYTLKKDKGRNGSPDGLINKGPKTAAFFDSMMPEQAAAGRLRFGGRNTGIRGTNFVAKKEYEDYLPTYEIEMDFDHRDQQAYQGGPDGRRYTLGGHQAHNIPGGYLPEIQERDYYAVVAGDHRHQYHTANTAPNQHRFNLEQINERKKREREIQLAMMESHLIHKSQLSIFDSEVQATLADSEFLDPNLNFTTTTTNDRNGILHLNYPQTKHPQQDLDLKVKYQTQPYGFNHGNNKGTKKDEFVHPWVRENLLPAPVYNQTREQTPATTMPRTVNPYIRSPVVKKLVEDNIRAAAMHQLAHQVNNFDTNIDSVDTKREEYPDYTTPGGGVVTGDHVTTLASPGRGHLLQNHCDPILETYGYGGNHNAPRNPRKSARNHPGEYCTEYQHKYPQVVPDQHQYRTQNNQPPSRRREERPSYQRRQRQASPQYNHHHYVKKPQGYEGDYQRGHQTDDYDHRDRSKENNRRNYEATYQHQNGHRGAYPPESPQYYEGGENEIVSYQGAYTTAEYSYQKRERPSYQRNNNLNNTLNYQQQRQQQDDLSNQERRGSLYSGYGTSYGTGFYSPNQQARYHNPDSQRDVRAGQRISRLVVRPSERQTELRQTLTSMRDTQGRGHPTTSLRDTQSRNMHMNRTNRARQGAERPNHALQSPQMPHIGAKTGNFDNREYYSNTSKKDESDGYCTRNMEHRGAVEALDAGIIYPNQPGAFAQQYQDPRERGVLDDHKATQNPQHYGMRSPGRPAPAINDIQINEYPQINQANINQIKVPEIGPITQNEGEPGPTSPPAPKIVAIPEKVLSRSPKPNYQPLGVTLVKRDKDGYEKRFSLALSPKICKFAEYKTDDLSEEHLGHSSKGSIPAVTYPTVFPLNVDDTIVEVADGFQTNTSLGDKISGPSVRSPLVTAVDSRAGINTQSVVNQQHYFAVKRAAAHLPQSYHHGAGVGRGQGGTTLHNNLNQTVGARPYGARDYGQSEAPQAPTLAPEAQKAVVAPAVVKHPEPAGKGGKSTQATTTENSERGGNSAVVVMHGRMRRNQGQTGIRFRKAERVSSHSKSPSGVAPKPALNNTIQSNNTNKNQIIRERLVNTTKTTTKDNPIRKSKAIRTNTMYGVCRPAAGKTKATFQAPSRANYQFQQAHRQTTQPGTKANLDEPRTQKTQNNTPQGTVTNSKDKVHTRGAQPSVVRGSEYQRLNNGNAIGGPRISSLVIRGGPGSRRNVPKGDEQGDRPPSIPKQEKKQELPPLSPPKTPQQATQHKAGLVKNLADPAKNTKQEPINKPGDGANKAQPNTSKYNLDRLGEAAKFMPKHKTPKPPIRDAGSSRRVSARGYVNLNLNQQKNGNNTPTQNAQKEVSPSGRPNSFKSNLREANYTARTPVASRKNKTSRSPDQGSLLAPRSPYNARRLSSSPRHTINIHTGGNGGQKKRTTTKESSKITIQCDRTRARRSYTRPMPGAPAQ